MVHGETLRPTQVRTGFFEVLADIGRGIKATFFAPKQQMAPTITTVPITEGQVKTTVTTGLTGQVLKEQPLVIDTTFVKTGMQPTVTTTQQIGQTTVSIKQEGNKILTTTIEEVGNIRSTGVGTQDLPTTTVDVIAGGGAGQDFYVTRREVPTTILDSTQTAKQLSDAGFGGVQITSGGEVTGIAPITQVTTTQPFTQPTFSNIGKVDGIDKREMSAKQFALGIQTRAQTGDIGAQALTELGTVFAPSGGATLSGKIYETGQLALGLQTQEQFREDVTAINRRALENIGRLRYTPEGELKPSAQFVTEFTLRSDAGQIALGGLIGGGLGSTTGAILTKYPQIAEGTIAAFKGLKVVGYSAAGIGEGIKVAQLRASGVSAAEIAGEVGADILKFKAFGLGAEAGFKATFKPTFETRVVSEVKPTATEGVFEQRGIATTRFATGEKILIGGTSEIRTRQVDIAQYPKISEAYFERGQAVIAASHRGLVGGAERYTLPTGETIFVKGDILTSGKGLITTPYDTAAGQVRRVFFETQLEGLPTIRGAGVQQQLYATPQGTVFKTAGVLPESRGTFKEFTLVRSSGIDKTIPDITQGLGQGLTGATKGTTATSTAFGTLISKELPKITAQVTKSVTQTTTGGLTGVGLTSIATLSLGASQEQIIGGVTTTRTQSTTRSAQIFAPATVRAATQFQQFKTAPITRKDLLLGVTQTTRTQLGTQSFTQVSTKTLQSLGSQLRSVSAQSVSTLPRSIQQIASATTTAQRTQLATRTAFRTRTVTGIAGFSGPLPTPTPPYLPHISIPKLNLKGLGLTSARGKERKYQYAPTITAIELGIKGTIPKQRIFAGVDPFERPIPTTRRTKKGKRI